MVSKLRLTTLCLLLAWMGSLGCLAQRAEGRPLRILTLEKGCRVWVDGREVGTSPHIALLVTGQHTIHALREDGMSSEIVRMNVPRGVGELPRLMLVFHDYVDLGLPSGTLWATTNVGASMPEDAGCYFAWAETQPVDSTTSANYTFKTEFTPQDDAATQYWGPSWQTPSIEQLRELVDKRYTITTWTMRGGTKGLLVQSRRGKHSLFLPAAGFSHDGVLKDQGEVGSYWSSTDGTTYLNGAHLLYFYDADTYTDFNDRFYGHCIRPVCTVPD